MSCSRPMSCPSNALHALTRAERRRIIAVGDAELHLLHILATGVGLLPYQPLLHRATLISSAERVGVYDCLYVAMAERDGCQFITADARLANNLRPRFPFVVELSLLP